MAFNGKVKCPACNSLRTVKVFHAAGVVFKGSGFYVTDSSNSRNAASGVSTNGDAAAESDTAETSDTQDKTDKKVAPAPSANGKEPVKDSSKTSGKDKK
jgi:predicted nucleic acid-binding Zn ribbon protein